MKAIILHNIRSAYNVGSLLRTADAIGISKVYMTGYTPSPIDDFGKKRKDISKVALGAEDSLDWQHHSSISSLLNKLKKEKVQIIAIEQSEGAVDYKKVKSESSCAFVLGNEVKGLSKSILNKADIVAQIPMKGKKESLNVAVSAGIALFRILD
jgi:tRNA G18 (ribose-2'-O)-methylase SpoU